MTHWYIYLQLQKRYQLPLITHLCCEGGVGVLACPTDAELLRQTCHLLYESDDRLELFVSFPERLLELFVGADQALQRGIIYVIYQWVLVRSRTPAVASLFL